MFNYYFSYIKKYLFYLALSGYLWLSLALSLSPDLWFFNHHHLLIWKLNYRAGTLNFFSSFFFIIFSSSSSTNSELYLQVHLTNKNDFAVICWTNFEVLYNLELLNYWTDSEVLFDQDQYSYLGSNISATWREIFKRILFFGLREDF